MENTMNRFVLTAVVTALCTGASLSARNALAQQVTETPQRHAKHTWLHLSEVIARPESCRDPLPSSGGKGLITFTTADGRSHVRCLELPAGSVDQNGFKQSTAGATETKPLALLSAYVAGPDGKPDPRFGPQPQDIVILTSGDGRVIVTFSDFSADTEAGSYPYPARVGWPGSPLE
jgi:hypothetical protein